ncbi:protein-methionine-sulfoxide reductase heme-binding subunit MsrQ [Undibacterium oligocarboniphilum]|uniref:Protein-methionine-sulfoxide reductase heme-binding subunit MsrQ n=1 Tax=Undibacterium oligocarboniphilum TaxID=666702 RepID=A0A850QHX3_9BURK|nr:protein-methionine-sulfoxide reductase heme-binding subunit MsrQ [Undibacterium oligocarboniphilum]MBC3870460.1 sulfoxide reductase heme-binding subunit YedZ [Undibacterium oligocarboniphilum]NVO78739.1 sulfoxide reductase heme-binding subunit YedZ [Undibacterium oligocarboniphilum]
MTPDRLQITRIKQILFVCALIPFLRLLGFALTDRLGANPLEFISRNTGDWTLYFLSITLAITPLRRLLHVGWIVQLRRTLGLFGFFYASLHFLTFLWFDHFFDLEEMWKDVLKRPFITVGFAAFVCLLPLALTSTNRMMKRLGRHWQTVHRLIYGILPLGVLHYYWMKAGKHDLSQPLLFALLISVLLALRLWWRWSGRRAASAVS